MPVIVTSEKGLYMLRKSIVVAVCGLGLVAGSASANAVPSPTFTIFGSVASQSFVDVNRNGVVPDEGDLQVLTGVLTNASGAAIGSWDAKVRFVAPHLAAALGYFHLRRGTIVVRGPFDPEAGPPPDLPVIGGTGVFQNTRGTLAVSDAGGGKNAFTFTL